MGNGIVTGMCAPAEDFEKQEPLYVGAVVSTVRIYASVLIWINLLLSVALLLISLVPGAGMGGSPVTFSALPRIVWLIPNLLALAFALHSVGSTSYSDIDGLMSMLVAAIVFMVASAVINIVHFVSLILECVEQSSTFYLQGFPYLVVFTVAIGVFMLWQMWIAARIYVYRATVRNALDSGWSPAFEAQQAMLNKKGYFEVPATSSSSSSASGPASAPGMASASQVGASMPLLFSTKRHTIGQKTE